MNVKILIGGIIFVSIAAGVYFGNYLRTSEKDIPSPSLKGTCEKDADCFWEITNCCPANSGAKWECIDLKTFEMPKCPANVICPQVMSPQPNRSCACIKGSCEAR